MRQSSATSPGKIILSGEHSVVYGCPALAIAVNRYATAIISSSSSDLLIVKEPTDLVQFAVNTVLEASGISFLEKVGIAIESDIPVGGGMGSSAAVILSVMKAMAHYLKSNFSVEKILQLAQCIESKQHGISSGLDIKTSLYGGCIFVKKDRIASRVLPMIDMGFVYTGAPLSDTRDCVAVAAPFLKDQARAQDFSAVTIMMESAIQKNNRSAIQDCIRENNRLLSDIGVVPERAQRFIADIEKINGAAKICGAGAIKGERAGMVWVMCDDTAAWEKIAEKYAYEVLPLQIELRGAYAY